MCGITGIIGKKASENLVLKMAESQQHRGPDYTGVWSDDKVSLAHNRLSIIDLTAVANQPFSDASKRYVIVFNGEIYNYIELKKELNYPFKTHSDTEVLLAAYLEWGEGCLHKLNGMFSFAIWDTKEETLFAARDRFGVKPFMYHFSEGTLYFASEIKALFAAGIPKKHHQKVWANYFAYGSYGMPNETFWEGVNQLSPGHFLKFSSFLTYLYRQYDINLISSFIQSAYRAQKPSQSFSK